MSKIKFSITVLSLLFVTNNLNAIEMTDYKVVEGYYQDAYVNGQVNIQSGNQEQTSYDVHVDANTRTVKSTLPYSWDFEALANSDFSQGDKDEDDSVDSYDMTAVTHFDNYIDGNEKTFVYGSGRLGYQKATTSDDPDDPYIEVGAGLGYGRVYNATPLAKALRIMEDLLKYKIVNKDLSDKGYIALAAIVDENKEQEFESKYGPVEYKKYWYEAIEKVLKENGILDRESLGAFGIVRIDEILTNEKVSQRLHGWKVRGGFGKVLSNYDGDSEDATINGEFEYGLPIGHESQFSENLYVSKLLDNDTDTELSLTNTMSYTYEVSDRIDWDNNWILKYQQNDKEEDITSNSFSTGFIYYLANRLNFTTTLSLSKRDGGPDEENAWNKSLVAGIQYRLK
ncbi:MAG: hypothetical protein GXO60_04210 [Epsilonproteobacteria bacterium]|nr:hypothetical protein [Campylobacterota bacterium]